MYIFNSFISILVGLFPCYEPELSGSEKFGLFFEDAITCYTSFENGYEFSFDQQKVSLYYDIENMTKSEIVNLISIEARNYFHPESEITANQILLSSWAQNLSAGTNPVVSEKSGYADETFSLYGRANNMGTSGWITSYGKVEEWYNGKWHILDEQSYSQVKNCGSDQIFSRVTASYSPTATSVSVLVGCDD